MKERKSNKPAELSRREFLKKAGLTVGGLALSSFVFPGGCAAKATSTSASATTPPASTVYVTVTPTASAAVSTTAATTTAAVTTTTAAITTTSTTAAGTTSTTAATTTAATTTTTIAGRTVGLFLNNSARAWPGYTLMAPKQYTSTYLLDNQGRAVHTWTASKYPPGQSAYLLENGHLIRACSLMNKDVNTGGGEGGRIEEFDWEGNQVWELAFSTDTYMQHHDFVYLPNGNVLMLVVEKKTYTEAVAAGLDPSQMADVQKMGYILPDSVYEVKPTKLAGGTIVWSWHVWDHLIQDLNASKNNYGTVAAHPELVDPNSGRQIPVFWNHMNSIAYNATLDQIVLSVRGNSEIWIIDHTTTTTQAASHAGGNHGKGGDLIYRWGNPSQYRAGTQNDEMLFQQHCGAWIPQGCQGTGDLLIFNNGIGRGYTTVDQITTPVDSNGNYALTAGSAYGPKTLNWTYKANPPSSFYADEISGAQRLPNGNTLICDGVHGMLFEVTSAGESVWKYINPVVKTGPLTSTGVIPPDSAKAGQFMNEVFRVYRYGADYAGLAGRDLTSGTVIEK